MSLGVGRTKLKEAFEVMQAHWGEVSRRWNDPVRQDFEENYWVPLEPDVRSALDAMDRLAQTLIRLRSDCG